MIAIYVRQSINKKDSLSIESQIEKCMTEITKNDNYKIYQDKGFSGKNINRPAFTELLQDIKKGLITKIIVYRLDRFSRSIADFGSIWKILSKFSVEFVSINEKFDTSSPIGVAMLNIIMVFAQLERETIAERIKDNYYMRAKTGSWLGGPAPFGFDIKKVVINNKLYSKLTPNKFINIVKYIFDEYANTNISLSELAKDLTQKEKFYITKKTWNNVSISRILHNPIYVKANFEIYLYLEEKGVLIENSINEFNNKKAGMLIGKRNKALSKYNDPLNQKFSLALHNGIIEPKIWLKCQEKLNNNNQLKNIGKGKHTWLSGLLKCGNCSYSLKIVCSKGKRYFVCSGKSNYHICNKSYPHINLSDIEFEIEKEINNVLKSDFFEPEIIKQNLESNNYVDKIKEIDKKINRLLNAITEGTSISIKYINKEIEKLELTRQSILENKENFHKTKTLTKPITKLNFSELNFEEKKKVAKSLITKIIVKDEEINIFWKI